MSAPNWKNRTLFHGDNLKFMRAMNSDTVDLIATDPPFNKGRDFHATPDSLAAGAKFQDRWSWERDVHEEWIDQLSDDYPRLMEAITGARLTHSDSMGAYLCFMSVRLLEMRRLLKPTGSVYLHCDPTASHYLKTCMDAVFGRNNFLNEIVWHYTGGGRSKTHYSRKHDVLFYYRKGQSHTFNVDAIRVPYKETSGYAKGGITARSGKHYYPHPDGTPVDDVWDIPIINPMAKEREGFPTQKPLKLYARIIAASSNEDDIIFDPFAGCATTLVAAEKLGRRWVGVDIWDGAHKIVVKRCKDTAGLFGDIDFTEQPPSRTDDGDTASPFLRVKVRVMEPAGPRWTRKQMYEHLIEQHGQKCQGCDRVFDDRRYLQLDHNTPRADGGINHITNRVLLCGPCNRAKSNIYTLSGLRKLNKEKGWMAR